MTEFSSQAIRDGLNLTTLIRWGARFGGSFRIDRDRESRWHVLIMRGGDLIARGGGKEVIVFDGRHADICRVVDDAAEAIKRTPEWVKYDATTVERARRARNAEKAKEAPRKKDYDIWDKRPRDLSGKLIN